MNTEPTDWTERLTSGSTLLASGLVVAVGLLLVPVEYSGPLKGIARAALRPAQQGASAAYRWGERFVDHTENHFGTVQRLVKAEQKIQQLRQENRRLRDELIKLQNRAHESDRQVAFYGNDRLLGLDHVTAHVLGRQARAFLEENPILDVGSQAGIRAGAAVVDPSVEWIDRGTIAGVQPGQLALGGSRVWGKVVEVAPQTSTVRTVTEPGYRDLVRLASPAHGAGTPNHWGPRGILEGRGRPLARICMIEVTEPVSVGDLVYTAAGKGILPEPLLYGSVVRLERPRGASHWDIWMQPAVRADDLRIVTVLQVQLNPLRVADRQGR